MTILCGPNGAGKSTVIRGLARAIAGGTQFQNFDLREIAPPGIFSVELTINETKHTLSTHGDQGPSAVVHVINPGDAASAIRQFFQSRADIGALLTGIGPRNLSDDELEDTSYVLGRKYNEIETYEIDIEFEASEHDRVLRSIVRQFEVLPYFRVCGAKPYGVESMGQGEIACLFLLWAARRAQNAFVLLEEPEAYLAPRAQRALMDVLAKRALASDLQIILATHSESILRQAPLENVRVLHRALDGSVSISQPNIRNESLKSLGVSIQADLVLVVEDEMAKRILVSILGHLAPEILTASEVFAAGDNSKIGRALEFPRGERFGVLGVFDGDQRENVAVLEKPKRSTRTSKPTKVTPAQPPKKADIRLPADAWPFAFLPGTRSPEVELLEILQKHEARAAKALGRSKQQLSQALASLQGGDPHDLFPDVARALGMDVGALVDAAVGLALKEKGFAADVRQLLEQIKSADVLRR
ncbi:AAA family ATPase [Archangium gephyra]